MKIGIISDTHDNLPKIKKAVGYFNKKKVDFVMHAGDFVAPFTIKFLEKLSCEWAGVFGNNDGEITGLTRNSQGKIKQAPLRTRMGRRKITLVHDINMLDIKSEKADLVIVGHTHRPKVMNSYGKLIINPGECCGWLYGKSSIAIADLDSLKTQIIKI